MITLKDEAFKTPSMCSTGGVFNCVAVAITPEKVGIRNNNDPSKTTLIFSASEWHTFIQAVKKGEFDLK